MAGVFACPECGSELELRGLSPGRQVRCGWCETWVEVPFIPRSPKAKRFRGKRKGPAWLPLAWGAVALLAVVVVVAGGARLVRSRAHAAREKALAELTASATAAERAGRLDQALTETEAALTLARDIDAGGSARVDALTRKRDGLAVREARARLDAVAGADPDQAVGECLTLLARIRKRPALAELEEPVREALERASRRGVEADAAAARRAFEKGRPDEAFRLCERMAKMAENLPARPRRAAREEAEALVTGVVRKHGLVLSPARGQFTFGSPASYAAALRPLVTDRLKPHGYLPCPPSSDWCPLWDRLAPYQLDVEVAERQAGNYMESQNRISILQARVILSLRGATLWERTVGGRTVVPLPNIPAYQGSRMASGDRPSPAFERLLYDSAHAILTDQIARVLRSAPDCAMSSAPSTTDPKTPWGSPLAGEAPSRP
jgi:hypothetical protein